MANDINQRIDLNLSRDERGRTLRAALFLTTEKAFRGGVRSYAQVFWMEPHCRVHCYGVGGDFNKPLLHNRTARATQKAIDTQHAAVFPPAVVEALTTEATAHYAQAAA